MPLLDLLRVTLSRREDQRIGSSTSRRWKKGKHRSHPGLSPMT